MFKFTELKQIHLEITNNCQASCPMCNRNINSGIANPLIKVRDWTLDQFKTIMNTDVLDQIDSYYFCGNFGDPILNNDLVEMCKWTSAIAPTVRVSIHTNGGARNTYWWKSLAKALPAEHAVLFALDGLADTHHLYRVGTKFETVINNATAFINAGGTAEWVFIKFKHNEHQVEQARVLADKLGFKKFTLKNSSRFILEPKVPIKNNKGNILHYIEPPTEVKMKFIDKKVIETYKILVSQSTITCKSQRGKEVYIDAYGDLYPCCWLAIVPYSHIDQDATFEVRSEILAQHHEMIANLGNINTLTKSVKDIIESYKYQTVWYDYWTKNKLITCARTCGTNTDFAKPRDQYAQ
jgi:MoaA/NifB/PqqE/SkfB family radical SAM enzyme